MQAEAGTLYILGILASEKGGEHMLLVVFWYSYAMVLNRHERGAVLNAAPYIHFRALVGKFDRIGGKIDKNIFQHFFVAFH